MVDIVKAAELLKSASRNSIVRPTGISKVIGLSGFIFNVVEDEEISIESDITDHYVEDNNAIQDHVALRPERFTVRGFVGELSQLFPSDLLKVVTKVQRLVVLTNYIPTLTNQATQKSTKIENDNIQHLNPIENAQHLYDIFADKNTTATKQQQAFNFFYTMYLSRQFFIVETPYNIFDNMVIESMKIVQGGETNLISDFSITFKKIRVAETQFLPTQNVFDGRSEAMKSSALEKGKSQGQPAETSALHKIFNEN